MAQTLFAIAGFHPTTPPLAECAVILIDVQRVYLAEPVALTGMPAALDEIAALLTLARAEGSHIVHVRHHARSDTGLFAPDAPSTAFIEGFESGPGEALVIKSLPNSFAGTDLHDKLQARGIRHVILAGFMTHMCVETTARAAIDLGYGVTVVGDATATRPLPGAGGQPAITAATLKAASLAALADRFARVVQRVGDL
jgi:nicotinamidase-related amidase